ncbi:MAG: NHL repeat-containing protein [Candidatus Zixiibacteriota bacterium]
MVKHLSKHCVGCLAVYLLVFTHLLTLPGCGPKSPFDRSNANIDDITGYVFVGTISGRIGSQVLSRPGAIAMDPQWNLIICDAGNLRLVKVKPDGTFLAEIGGFGFSRENFAAITDIATPDRVNFYVLDSSNSRIVRLDDDLNWISATKISTLADNDNVGRLHAIAVNSFGDIFLSDPDNNRIVKLDRKYELLQELTGYGGFFFPGRLAIDADDNLFVVGRNRKQIAAYDSYDNFLGDVTAKPLDDPAGLWVDRRGVLYLVDRKLNSVSIFGGDGKELYSFGSTGTGDYQFRRAESICVNNEGWIFVSDTEGDRVMVFRPNRQ